MHQIVSLKYSNENNTRWIWRHKKRFSISRFRWMGLGMWNKFAKIARDRGLHENDIIPHNRVNSQREVHTFWIRFHWLRLTPRMSLFSSMRSNCWYSNLAEFDTNPSNSVLHSIISMEYLSFGSKKILLCENLFSRNPDGMFQTLQKYEKFTIVGQNCVYICGLNKAKD